MIKINGVLLNFSETTLAEYLKSTTYNSRLIAVELNGEIVPKAKYDETLLKDGDTVEIVSFVGGG